MNKQLMAYIATLVLIISAGSMARAQEVNAGVKGGMNFSTLIQNEIDDQDMRLGWQAGFYSKIRTGERFFVMPEVLFSTKGVKYNYDFLGSSGDIKLNLYYIDVPVMLGFHLTEQLAIEVGPYASYLVDAGYKDSGDNEEDELDRDNFKSFDYGLAGGLSYSLESFMIGARYNYGLAEIAESDVADFALENSRNSVAQLYVAFRLTD
ncbi:Outer membrane protein beta-barrel domain-containing protein [Reichenbachiella agariperforans]|uniref:Outer membrane protein beta-barrel domain-containing protein n=1 Tax=Reichenbachiella agariperforans TaxID=156994 RepID=A0A1M6P391_REIAG|nr:porin family protein [Reichenbachiella agariperforans]SHK02435.1 Outer membrane protein beta-barrel domain-containing protein [Reichenbachiella agariperforans]